MSDQPGKPEQPASANDPRRLARAQAAVDAMKRPQRIGPYRILETLGEGGMGVVYLAEQEKPLHRRVALKIIKLGMDTKNVMARFEAEREALALMNHPNVARVFDASSTEEGRPFFVMEYVPGLPITEYCDRHRVSTEDRLRLFMEVCHAVQHAHQKGIIHRDIKPSNVLVTVQDDKPVPKVIDFGVAKATQQRLTELTVFTEQGQLIGTPGYMSPEQADFTAMDIDTRTDVYSLGVLLYELLVGALPFDTRFLLAAGWLELQRIIREVDPPRPSTRLSAMKSEPRASARAMVRASDAPTDSESSRRLKPAAQDQYRAREEADSSSTQSLQPAPPNLQSPISNPQSQDPITAVAHRRRTQPATLLRILRGDLDWVVMKCLEKDRTRRYDTANALAMDVQRFLSNEPVLAGPPNVAYRFRKFVRRNRAQVALAAAILLGITATLVGTLFMYARSEESTRVAEAALESEAEQRSVAEKAMVEAQEARTEAETAYAMMVEERDRAVDAQLADMIFRDSATYPYFDVEKLLYRGENLSFIQGAFCEAEPLLLEAYSQMVELEAVPWSLRKHALQALAQLYEDWDACEPNVGHREKAREFRGLIEDFSPPAILLECVDYPDPIEINSNLVYTITVTNQDSTVGTNIAVNCTLPNEQSFVSTEGPCPGSATAKRVSFAPLAKLAPRAKAVYRVTVKCVGEGDVRFRVDMKSDQMETPVMETESTRIHR